MGNGKRGGLSGARARSGVGPDDQRAQVRRDPAWRGRRTFVHGRDDAPDALGVSRLIERQQRREVVAGTRIDEIDAREVPSRDSKSKVGEGAIRGWHLEADPLDGDGAIASSLLARDLDPKRAPECVGARALAADARTAEVAIERCLLDLGVLLAVVLLLDPRSGRDVEQVEGERGLALEHREKPPFDLSPEGLLFAVLLRRVRPE